VKKVTFNKRPYSCQIHLQGKMLLSWGIKTLLNDFTSNLFLEGSNKGIKDVTPDPIRFYFFTVS
jgi:hypothetical protein